jgi:adenylate cyclase
VVVEKRRFWSGRRRWILIGLLLTVIVFAIQVMWMTNPDQMRLITRLDNLFYDARFALFPPQRQPLVPIAIVDLDEFSIQREGRWPWDRKKIARMVANLQTDGVALIGLDMIFSEPSRNPVKQVLKQTSLPADLRERLVQQEPAFDSDQAFARVIGRNTVLGYFFQNDNTSAGQLPFPFYQLSGQEQLSNSLLSMSNYTGNIPILADNAMGQGFVVAVPDMDGVVRRVPLVIRYQDGVYASLSLTLAQLALDAPWIKLNLANSGPGYVATGINIGNRVTVPVDADGSMLVPFRGYARSFPTISATRVIEGDLSPKARETLKGAIVLVGTSALGLSDLRTIPLQTAYPGVEVHANVLDAILQAALGKNTFYRQPDWSSAASLLLLLLIGVLLAWLLPGRSPLAMLALALLICLVLVVGLNVWLWQVKHFALPMALPWVMWWLLTGFNLAVGFIETSRNKREVENLFGEYVPPDYVKLMLSESAKASMEGEQRNMTVLFADVCGFTTLSEALTTSELKHLLNRYLTEVTGIIFAHKGTIDKYVGDMVMAFWNAPLNDDHHARNGVLAALSMQQKVALLRDEFVREGLPALAVGIGLNSGPMNVGDMGSSYRRAYTVLGDAVNLGSRLEGLTRFYGVDILVSEATRDQCEGVLFRPIDRIRVKGKHEPVEVFEPLCLESEVEGTLVEQVRRFVVALEAYRLQRFSEAREIFVELLAEDDTRETLYRCYLERIAGFEVAPPAADWQAVYTHTSK